MEEEKLKTLKEMERCPDCKASGKDRGFGCVQFIDLRAEAVKWYKNLNNIDEGDWRKFFNLTEDDLK